MFLLHRPTESEIIQHLLDHRDAPFSYSDVGASNREPPAGFHVDHHRVKIGDGEATFQRGRFALTQWKMYPAPFAELCFPDRPATPGTVVAALLQVGPIWSLNPCRVVYTVDEESSDGIRRFGFAIGTLPDHAECGEERFLVEWDLGDDSVWYDLLAFSRPRHVFAKCLYPYARRLQRQFRLRSAQSMLSAGRVENRVDSPTSLTTSAG